ncbi:hypothetical protein DPMN_044039 [Dreissena polymorpha]|uniref:Uncharacterized protein n=1 Tax=Dreissena polymorpha TaxID=45954 RepID=A0A9D4D1K0_DREPO|nr:hypothetical protein DPMN_044039 [Dreissena polymorpha]
MSRIEACLSMPRRTDAKLCGEIRLAAAYLSGFNSLRGIDSLSLAAADREICLFRLGCTVGVNVVSAVRTDSAPTPPASRRFVKNCSVPPNVVLWTKPAFYCIKKTPQMDEVLRLFIVAIHTSLSLLRRIPTIVDVSN